MASTTEIEEEKRAAAEAAAQLVEPGSRVGLGTGSTVAYLLPALVARGLDGLRCVATSPRTEDAARALGLQVEAFDDLDELDVAIDGADEVAPDGWLVKGGGGAHLREKIVAAASHRFVVIASSDKPVPRIVAPVPLELSRFGLASTLRELPDLRIRENTPPSPDGGVIADYIGTFASPQALVDLLEPIPGVLAHGLFPPALVSDVLVATASGVEHRVIRA